MKTRAQVVVIGGGVGGCSILYWLTRLGWRDVVLVERAELTSGSTFHSAGLVGQLRSSLSLTKMMMSSVELYRTLGEEVGLETGWREVGSLRLASTPERMEELARQSGWAKTFGLPLELVSADAAQKLFPPMSTDGVLGAAYLPTDGYIDPSQLTFALAEGARRGGAEIYQQTRVTAIGVERGRVTGVVTDQGEIEADVVVNAGGMFAKEIGALAGVNVPIVPMAHEYLVTKPSGLPTEMAQIRDPSLLVYFRPESGGLIMGGYERHPAPWALDGIPPDFNGKLLAEDWPRFEELMRNALIRVPSLEEMEVVKLINGPEAFTPDGEFILGPTEVRGFWTAAGFCAHGLAGAGGLGQLVAEWIVDGVPSLDVWHMDSRRFGRAYRSADYTLARTLEVYGTYYDVKYPGHERKAGRPLRLSPAYPRLAELGASFGEKSGWERANWFEPNAARGDEALRPRGWAGRNWSPAIGAEHLACRETAAIFDETSFAKIEISGEGAPELVERLCANRVAREIGAITYTQMLNARGGIECDFTVTRLGEERFRVVTGTAFGQHDLAWIREHAPDGVAVDDVTSAHACFGVWGPRAREILQPLTNDRARLPVHAGPRARGWFCPVPGTTGHLRRRARLGALLPDRVRRRALGLDLGARPRSRSRRRRLPRDRLAPAREGLPRLGLGHHAGRHALRGGARFRREARQGRLHRAPGAARGAGAQTAALLPRARRSAVSRARLGARSSRGGRGRARDERRLRLLGRALDRLRLPARGPCKTRAAGRGRDLRGVDAGRGCGRAALGSERRTHPGVIDELVARVWPAGVESVEPLGGGITNRNFKVRAGDEEFVLRIGGKDTELLGIDRDVEHAVARAAASLGLGPEVTAYLEPEGYLVTRFVEGEVGKVTVPAAAALLRRLHAAPPIPGRFDAFRVVSTYSLTARERGVPLPPGFREAQATADRIERRRGRYALVPCHNDLLAANFIDSGDRLWIVDWEYAGMGDAAFDLANFAVSNGLDDDGDRELLEAYGGADLGVHVLMRFMSDFREAAWGLVQLAVADIDVRLRGLCVGAFRAARSHRSRAALPPCARLTTTSIGTHSFSPRTVVYMRNPPGRSRRR